MGAKTDHITQAEGDLFTSASGAAIAYSLELGCDPRRTLHLNQTNLFVAVQRKDAEKVQLLVETYGLDVNHKDSIGQTCLFYAANLGVVDITKQLLGKYKADALIEDNHGRTARSYAETHSKHPQKTETLKLLAAAEKKQRKVLENAQRKQRVAEAKAEKARQRAAAAAAAKEARLAEAEAAKAAKEAVEQLRRDKATPATISKRGPSSESSSKEPKRRKYTIECFEGNEAVPRNSAKYNQNLDQLYQLCPLLKRCSMSSVNTLNTFHAFTACPWIRLVDHSVYDRPQVTEIKRQRLENEEEIERLKVMLQAQEQRNAEQLVTIDKYHAVVASHEAEVRQIQMLLECEREEAARKMAELQDAFAAAQKSLEQRLDQYRFSYEDLRALICLREDEKSKEAERAKRNSLEEQVRKLNAQMELVQEESGSNLKRAQNAETQVRHRDMQIDDLNDSMNKVQRERDEWRDKLDKVLPDVEHSSMGREDSLMQYERIRHSTEVFEEVRTSLERQLSQAKMEIQRLVAAMQRHTVDASTQVMLSISEGQVQTDLSYQYLEVADHLQGDRWRRDRLDSLKRASNFVEDPEERRDFTVIMRTTAPPVAQLGPDAQASSFPLPCGDSSWPGPRPPLAQPSVSSQKIQAMRRSFPSAGSSGFHVAQVKTTGVTTT
eukprot:symbB.v1.2.015360.t1/scaffold1140.1/size135646/11